MERVDSIIERELYELRSKCTDPKLILKLDYIQHLIDFYNTEDIIDEHFAYKRFNDKIELNSKTDYFKSYKVVCFETNMVYAEGLEDLSDVEMYIDTLKTNQTHYKTFTFKHYIVYTKNKLKVTIFDEHDRYYDN